MSLQDAPISPNTGDHRRPLFVSVVQFDAPLRDGRMSLDQFMDAAHELGANGVELRPEPFPDFPHSVETTRMAAQKHGLLITWATMATLFNADSDGAANLRYAIETAADLNALAVRVFSGEAPPRDAPDHAWDDARQAIDYAESLGVRVLLENAVTGPGSHLADVARIFDVVPHDNLGANVDIGNFAQSGTVPLEAVAYLKERIASVHWKDAPGDPAEPAAALGSGILPIEDLRNALDALPQPLLYILEFPGGGDPYGRIRQSFEVLTGNASQETL